jgi:hypothetical protein
MIVLMRRWTFVLLTAAALVAATGTGASAANQWPVTVVAEAHGPAGRPSWIAWANGGGKTYRRGDFYGGAGQLSLAQPIVGIAATRSGKGYRLVARDGGIFAFGDAHFYGSMGATHLNQPIVGIATTKSGRGYWLAAADGGIFTFGDARFLGSLGGTHLDQPIVGITATRSGNGYRLVARDGGVFTFGDATYQGSLGGQGVSDVVGLAPTPSGNGYWILRALGGTYCSDPMFGCPDGPPTFIPYPGYVPGKYITGPSVYNFGDAKKLPPFFGHAGFGGRPVYEYDFSANPIVAIASNPVHQGYSILRAKHGTYGFAGSGSL